MKKKLKKLYLQKNKRSFKKIIGNLEKPRLSVFRSHNHIYAQLIDDHSGKTLLSSSTIDKHIAKDIESTNTESAAFIVGCELAKRALIQNIKVVIFDRGEKPYKGRIKKLAEGARQEGLVF